MSEQQVTWLAPSGVSVVLSDPPYGVRWEKKGHLLPPAELIEEKVPLRSGARLREARYLPRDVELPIRLLASTDAQLRGYERALAELLDVTAGDGLLRVTSALGDSRELVCRLTDGFLGEDTEELFGTETNQTFRLAVLVFHATDPFWRDTAETTAAFTTGSVSAFLGSPFLPLKIARGTVWAQPTVTNTGSLEAWPIWTIQGPGSALTLRNESTGKQLSLNFTLGLGETATIDTSLRVKTVLRQDNLNLYPYLTGTLFSLQKGANALTISLTGATVDSAVTLRYRQRYLTA